MQSPRPITRSRTASRGYRRQAQWPAFSWWLSLLFLFGVAAWAVTFLVKALDDDDSQTAASFETVAIIVNDASNGLPLTGAQVRIGDQTALSNESGTVEVTYPSDRALVTIQRDGFHPVYGEFDPTMSLEQRIALNPLTVLEPEQNSGQPDDAAVQLEGAAALAESGSTTSDSGASNTSSDLLGVTGIVTTDSGEPIGGAVILAGEDVTFSDDSGYFEAANATSGTPLRIWASGYADAFPVASQEGDMMVRLNRMDVKAAYLTGAKLADEAKITELIDIIETTELNALVIDIKEGYVYYDTSVAFFQDADAVFPVFDPAALVQRLRGHGIYTIARIVVFNDPIVAKNRPDLAIQDDNGGVWEGWNGDAWVDPFKRELWQPNIDLALEAAAMGFDEIQYDYVRLPSDGDLNTANFAGEYNEESRVGTIVAFLEMTQDQLRPTGAKLGADVFGIIAVYPQDQGIGQRMLDFAEVVDFIHPMVYPSHFTEGSIGVDGHPNDFPYETLDITIGLGVAKIPGMALKMRPWLQDFSWDSREYGPAEIRDQIDGTMKHGASGWMLWNAGSTVTIGGLSEAS
ncbi:hypothetical protein BH23CHL5_BH23CHL5_17030 [soil metagenome]